MQFTYNPGSDSFTPVGTGSAAATPVTRGETNDFVFTKYAPRSCGRLQRSPHAEVAPIRSRRCRSTVFTGSRVAGSSRQKRRNFGACIRPSRDASDEAGIADHVWSIEEIVSLLE